MVQKKLVTKSLKASAFQLKKHLKIHHAVEYKILETMEEERKAITAKFWNRYYRDDEYSKYFAYSEWQLNTNTKTKHFLVLVLNHSRMNGHFYNKWFLIVSRYSLIWS